MKKTDQPSHTRSLHHQYLLSRSHMPRRLDLSAASEPVTILPNTASPQNRIMIDPDYTVEQDDVGSTNEMEEYIAEEPNLHLGHLFASETNLSQYTDNHFVHRLNEDLEKIRNMATTFVPVRSLSEMPRYINSNSPLTLSNDNSDSDNDANTSTTDRRSQHFGGSSSHSIQIDRSLRRDSFRNLTFQEAEQYLDKYYDEHDTKYSSELDILITYMKGQKNLYIQSKNICEYKLNALLIPSLLTIAAITIFAPFIQRYDWSGGFISGLNAISTLLITLANYLKLESSTQTFYHTANQYDKLETSLEFVASKMLFIHDEAEKSRIVLDKIQEVEKKINEIKEWNSLFVPEQVRRMFPIICHINVFSFIKRMEVYKKNLIIKFKDIKNEIRYIVHQLSKIPPAMKNGPVDDTCSPVQIRQQQRLQFLLEVKDKIKDELNHYKTAYGHIDDLFTQEIKEAQNHPIWGSFWNTHSNITTQTAIENISRNHPVIHQYLHHCTTTSIGGL